MVSSIVSLNISNDWSMFSSQCLLHHECCREFVFVDWSHMADVFAGSFADLLHSSNEAFEDKQKKARALSTTKTFYRANSFAHYNSSLHHNIRKSLSSFRMVDIHEGIAGGEKHSHTHVNHDVNNDVNNELSHMESAVEAVPIPVVTRNIVDMRASMKSVKIESTSSEEKSFDSDPDKEYTL